MKSTKEKIAVMKQSTAGDTLLIQDLVPNDKNIWSTLYNPSWNWEQYNYRTTPYVKELDPPRPPSDYTNLCIEVMEAFEEGNLIQQAKRHGSLQGWGPSPNPTWNFAQFKYRKTRGLAYIREVTQECMEGKQLQYKSRARPSDPWTDIKNPEHCAWSWLNFDYRIEPEPEPEPEPITPDYRFLELETKIYRDVANGNTYFSARIFEDGEELAIKALPFQKHSKFCSEYAAAEALGLPKATLRAYCLERDIEYKTKTYENASEEEVRAWGLLS